MGQSHGDLKSVDPKAPHGYVERPSLPYSIPKAFGPGVGGGPEIPFKRVGVDACTVCGQPRSDQLHAASEDAADAEQWPV
jgi:hypothetical protein